MEKPAYKTQPLLLIRFYAKGNPMWIIDIFFCLVFHLKINCHVARLNHSPFSIYPNSPVKKAYFRFLKIKTLSMKKLLTAAAIVLVSMAACNDNSTKETSTTVTDSTETKQGESRANEISDSTKMLDKKLADPNSTYSPDSLK
jgi:hypothetical protein